MPCYLASKTPWPEVDWYEYIWSGTRHNLQHVLCAQRRLRSVCTVAHTGALWVTNDPRTWFFPRTYYADAQANLSVLLGALVNLDFVVFRLNCIIKPLSVTSLSNICLVIHIHAIWCIYLWYWYFQLLCRTLQNWRFKMKIWPQSVRQEFC